MHREDLGDEIPCIACGELVTPGTSRAFLFGDNSALCSRCALKRGGRFDSEQERWTTPPDVQGLSSRNP